MTEGKELDEDLEDSYNEMKCYDPDYTGARELRDLPSRQSIKLPKKVDYDDFIGVAIRYDVSNRALQELLLAALKPFKLEKYAISDTTIWRRRNNLYSVASSDVFKKLREGKLFSLHVDGKDHYEVIVVHIYNGNELPDEYLPLYLMYCPKGRADAYSIKEALMDAIGMAVVQMDGEGVTLKNNFQWRNIVSINMDTTMLNSGWDNGILNLLHKEGYKTRFVPMMCQYHSEEKRYEWFLNEVSRQFFSEHIENYEKPSCLLKPSPSYTAINAVSL